MKKITWLVIMAALLLWACGDETEPKPGTDTDSAANTDTAVTDDTVTDDVVPDDAASDEILDVDVPATCGNGIIDAGETCDGGSVYCGDLDEKWSFGTAYCNDACSGYETYECQEPYADDDETPDIDNGNCFNLGTTYVKGDLPDVATGISLVVYSDGWGVRLDTLTMDTEGTITLNVPEENPYDGQTPHYFIYETADGFFTNAADAKFGDTITVDLDPVMPDNLINGNIFMIQSYFGPTALANTAITVTDTNGATIGCFTTDGTGRFVINLPAGDYRFQFQDMDMALYDKAVSTTGPGDYLDLRIEAQAQAAKPNIYLYPLETTDVSVTLGFPLGGFVTTSIPDYGDGWQVTVDPDGTIDGQFGYLFYEAQQPDQYQYAEGWTVAKQGLEKFFRANLAAYGFAGREIEDFIAWWIPRLNGGPCYDLFPQTAAEIDPLITLDITPTPDSLQRLFYAVRATDACGEHLATPLIEPFARDGFTALEWGVIVK
ncbi:MAG TPA: carboxypeptidase-like regulatory domain-containing protein [bacterium]|nr:carboxypeptidase-like regulatory domain-containing protein [bacterium]